MKKYLLQLSFLGSFKGHGLLKIAGIICSIFHYHYCIVVLI